MSIVRFVTEKKPEQDKKEEKKNQSYYGVLFVRHRVGNERRNMKQVECD